VVKRSETVSIERHVGQRIRARRTMLGFTQQQLADLIGVTYQQAHKYERGINRVSAGRLFELAKALGVDVSFFYEGLAPGEVLEAMPERQRLCLDMARNFARIREERHQEALSQLCRALADEQLLDPRLLSVVKN
jgi:DNA-binding XRE family transcriptional regulator